MVVTFVCSCLLGTVMHIRAALMSVRLSSPDISSRLRAVRYAVAVH